MTNATGSTPGTRASDFAAGQEAGKEYRQLLDALREMVRDDARAILREQLGEAIRHEIATARATAAAQGGDAAQPGQSPAGNRSLMLEQPVPLHSNADADRLPPKAPKGKKGAGGPAAVVGLGTPPHDTPLYGPAVEPRAWMRPRLDPRRRAPLGMALCAVGGLAIGVVVGPWLRSVVGPSGPTPATVATATTAVDPDSMKPPSGDGFSELERASAWYDSRIQDRDGRLIDALRTASPTPDSAVLGAVKRWDARRARGADLDLVHDALLQVALNRAVGGALSIDGHITRAPECIGKACPTLHRVWQDLADQREADIKPPPRLPGPLATSDGPAVEKYIVKKYLGAGQ